MGRDMHSTDKSMLTMPCPKEIPYMEVSFGTYVPKFNFHIRFLEVHIILNQSQDAI
jgi:hypothetical protein